MCPVRLPDDDGFDCPTRRTFARMTAAIQTRALRKEYPAPAPRRGRAPAPPASPVPPASPGCRARPDRRPRLARPRRSARRVLRSARPERRREDDDHRHPHHSRSRRHREWRASRAPTCASDDVRVQAAHRRRAAAAESRPQLDGHRESGVPCGVFRHGARHGGQARAHELLERLGIGDKANAKVDELSGGQQQRLMIARALIHEPRVLFLDEPTVGLDPQARLALWEILRDLHAQGRTIVMTTHYMEEADQLCDRLAIIDHGRLLACDTPDNLRRRRRAAHSSSSCSTATRDGRGVGANRLPGSSRVEARRQSCASTAIAAAR